MRPSWARKASLTARREQIRPASFIGNRETVTANADFLPAQQRKSDAAGADDDDAAVAVAMRPDTGDWSHRSRKRTERNGMRPRIELFKHGFAADAGHADDGIHMGNRVWR